MSRGAEADVPWSRCPYSCLPVSLIAEHSYCEKRLELWLNDPGERVSVPRELENAPEAARQEDAALAGRRAHERMAAAAVLVPREVAEEAARERQAIIVESGFAASFDGLPIKGIPDVACFDHGRATAVLDYKFRRSRSLELAMGERVQLYLYGYLLEESGYDASDLLLICVYAPRESGSSLARGDSEVVRAITRSARAEVEQKPERTNWRISSLELPGGFRVGVRCFFYDRRKAETELEFAAGFWHGRRPAMPTTYARKCASCLYNYLEACPDALTPFRERPGVELSCGSG